MPAKLCKEGPVVRPGEKGKPKKKWGAIPSKTVKVEKVDTRAD